METLFGVGVAQGVVAVVFALEHVARGVSWTNAVFGAGVGSLLFGMAAIASRGLALPIGIHAGWNCGGWLRGGKDSGGVWRAVVDEGFEGRVQLVGIISYAIIFLATTFILWRWNCLSEGGWIASRRLRRPSV